MDGNFTTGHLLSSPAHIASIKAVDSEEPVAPAVGFLAQSLLAGMASISGPREAPQTPTTQSSAAAAAGGLVEQTALVADSPEHGLLTRVAIRYVYHGAKMRHSRLVSLMAANPARVSGAAALRVLSKDGVDLSRWYARHFDRRHEAFSQLSSDSALDFSHDERCDIELYERDERILPEGVPQDWEKAAGKLEGFFGVGVYRGKTESNHGSLWRSAWQLGASFIFTVGARFKRTAGDTTNAHLNLPCYTYTEWPDFAKARPHSTSLVAVEMGGVPLADFEHPERAIYLLGSEDNGLPKAALEACHHVVSLPSVRSESFNVAVAGSLIMFDRYTKRATRRGEPEAPPRLHATKPGE